MFPIKAKQYEKKEKYLHIVLLVTGMVHSIKQSHDFNLSIQSISYTYQPFLHSFIFLSIFISSSVHQYTYRCSFNSDTYIIYSCSCQY